MILQDPSSPARGQRLQSLTTTFPTRTLSPDAGGASGGGAEDRHAGCAPAPGSDTPRCQCCSTSTSIFVQRGRCMCPAQLCRAGCLLSRLSVCSTLPFGCCPCSAHGASAGLRGILPLISTLPQSPKRSTASGNAHLEARMPRDYEVGVPRFSVKGGWRMTYVLTPTYGFRGISSSCPAPFFSRPLK